MPDRPNARRPPQPQPRAECAISDTLAIGNVDELWRAAGSAGTLSAIFFRRVLMFCGDHLRARHDQFKPRRVGRHRADAAIRRAAGEPHHARLRRAVSENPDAGCGTGQPARHRAPYHAAADGPGAVVAWHRDRRFRPRPRALRPRYRPAPWRHRPRPEAPESSP